MNMRRVIAALVGGAFLLAGSAVGRPPALAQSISIVTSAPQSPLPVRLVIPAIHVSAPIELVGDAPDGAMQAPREWADVGWYARGFRPGDPGSAVIAGHLDSATHRAVFWDLNRLNLGDVVQVQNDDGSQLSFAVVSHELYDFDNAPLQRIFGSAAAAGLNLVTCDGSFDWGSKNYDKRLVVYTQQISVEPAI